MDGSSSVHLPSLDYGVHRFEARAVLDTGTLDPTPASFDWTIAHCNDPNRIPEQYASVDARGALVCTDCPHAVGSNCKTLDVTWEGIYANKGWWTAGDPKDTYYKCPFKTACLGGETRSGKNNGTVRYNTTKSRCDTGYAGVVCAICSKGYYLMDDLCLPCLPANGGAETLVIVVFSGAFGFFSSIFFVNSLSVSFYDLKLMILMGALAIGLGITLVTLAAPFVPSAEVSVLVLLESVLGPLWVWMFLKESVSQSELAGGFIILFSVFLLSYPMKRMIK